VKTTLPLQGTRQATRTTRRWPMHPRSGEGSHRTKPESLAPHRVARPTAPSQRLQVVTSGLDARDCDGLATQASAPALSPDNRRAVPHSQAHNQVLHRRTEAAPTTTRPEGHASQSTHPPAIAAARPAGYDQKARHAPCLPRGETTEPNAPDNPKAARHKVRTPGNARHSHPKAKRTQRTGRPSHGTRGTHARPHTQTPTRTRPRPRPTIPVDPCHHRDWPGNPTANSSTDTDADSVRRDAHTTHPTANPSRSRTQSQAFPIAMPLTSSAPKDTPGGGQHRQT
jgi:hypothetical protein